MNFFNYITKGGNKSDDRKKQAEPEKKRSAEGKNVSAGKTGNAKNTIPSYHPKSYDEVADVIDSLLAGNPAIVYLNELSANTAQRVIDLLSGALYAINGNLGVIEKDVYIITPSGVRTD